MKRVPINIILTIWLGFSIVVSGLLMDGKGDINSAGAVDQAIAFELRAGYIGRSELYARENIKRIPQTGDGGVSVLNWNSTQVGLTDTLTHTTYLPLTAANELTPMVERRGLWITRYDWTSYNQTPSPGDIADMVDDVSSAGFNTIFFQIRAAGDSFYTPGLEPWSARLTTGPVSETLGVDPGWDPLMVMVQTAQDVGIELHAYVNVYTAWLSPSDDSQGQLWPPATTPSQMFDLFTYNPFYTSHPGVYALGYTWRQYLDPDTPMPLEWNRYLWASPGVDEVQDHIVSVATDILSRYDLDGIHLDLVRYAGPSYSYDPFSNAAASTTRTLARDQWQRDRISSLVSRISIQAHTLHPNILVSAAVWPVYEDKWGWGASEGYSDYFQDSKGWLQNGTVDAIAPMLYGGVADEFTRWQILMEDFVGIPSPGQIYPGIGVYDDFTTMDDRITAVREAGTPGHVIFSYSGLKQRNYWNDLRYGPYAVPAVVPTH